MRRFEPVVRIRAESDCTFGSWTSGCQHPLGDEAAEATSPQGLENRVGFTRHCDGFGSLLGTHPGDDTETDLVDHVSDVVEDGHDFCINSVGQNVSGWVEQVAERVDDPANTDEPAQSVGAPHELISDLAVVDTLTGGPWGTGSDDDHGPADTTEDESGHTRMARTRRGSRIRS